MNGTDIKIAAHVELALRQALSALTGRDYGVSQSGVLAAEAPGGASSEDAVCWQQRFAAEPGPVFWLEAGRDLWEFFGRAILEAAGIEEASDEDCRSTWQEVVSQTVSGVAAGITADIVMEVTTGKGEMAADTPAGLDWFGFPVDTGDGQVHELRAAWSEGLREVYEPKPAAVRSSAGRENAVSKTFDLLLEVALPVSVSFGKTMLQIREVLKLSTGSIVELDRLVSDPVEVIVNDCVIARGEVVVVDGNYGVRVSQLASREDRLRTGIADSARIGVRP